jgi:hypothetical protein
MSVTCLPMLAGAVLDHVPFIYLGFVNCQRFTQCCLRDWAMAGSSRAICMTPRQITTYK